jgi:micrococcal nuclease
MRAGTILLVAGLAVWQHLFPRDRNPPAFPESGANVFVVRAVDGDTLLLADHTRVRLIGADSPETKRPDFPVEPFGPAAHEFTRRYVEGRAVRLEFDKERRDQYNRILAYVYVDDTLLNEELIRAGLARVLTKYPYSEAMKRRFRAAQAEAKRERRGIWHNEN